MKPGHRKWCWAVGTILALLAAAAIGFWERPVSYFDEFMYINMRLAGVQSRYMNIEGQRLHYLAEGPAGGPVVVLVHGLGGRAEDWRDLAPYLARAGYRVYMPDLLGYGRSARPADFSYSVRAEAGVVAGFMDALRLKQVDLGGWSMGGWVAQLVAIEHPNRVSRLMLFDSAGLSDKPSWNTNLFTPTTPAELDQLEAILRPHPQAIPGFVARDVLRISREHAWIIKRAMGTMLTGRDTTDNLLPELKMPVLIAWGGADRTVPPAEGEQMHRLIPQSQLDVFPGCGHLAPLYCAAEIGPKAVTFVKD